MKTQNSIIHIPKKKFCPPNIALTSERKNKHNMKTTIVKFNYNPPYNQSHIHIFFASPQNSSMFHFVSGPRLVLVTHVIHRSRRRVALTLRRQLPSCWPPSSAPQRPDASPASRRHLRALDGPPWAADAGWPGGTNGGSKPREGRGRMVFLRLVCFVLRKNGLMDAEYLNVYIYNIKNHNILYDINLYIVYHK